MSKSWVQMSVDKGRRRYRFPLAFAERSRSDRDRPKPKNDHRQDRDCEAPEHRISVGADQYLSATKDERGECKIPERDTRHKDRHE
jgi:hypothetical protein